MIETGFPPMVIRLQSDDTMVDLRPDGWVVAKTSRMIVCGLQPLLIQTFSLTEESTVLLIRMRER